MRIRSTNPIEGGRVLYTIGRIEAASTGHPAHGSPLQETWRELVLRELIRKAEDIDPDAIIRVIARPASRAVDERLSIIIDFEFAGGERVAQINFQRAVGSKADAHAGIGKAINV